MITYACFFDLDGTLIDSRDGLFNSFRAGLAEIGTRTLSDAELQIFLGTPLPEMLRTVKPEVSAAEIDTGIRAFRRFYEKTGIYQSRLYPGARATLELFRSLRLPVWIVTSKPEVQARRVIEEFDLNSLIRGVVGAGPDETDTKTELVARALKLARLGDPATAVMVGDRFYDVVGARENGVVPIGALWGYGTKSELEAAGCSLFAESLGDLQQNFMSAPQIAAVA